MQKKRWILPLFFLFQIIGLKILSFFPELIEKYYSNGLYPYISKFSRNAFGWIPFSFGDFLYTILMFWLIYWLYKNWKMPWKCKTIAVLSFLSLFYFAFHFLWAFNYYRLPLFQKMSIKKEYSDAQLLDFTKKVIAKTNEIQFQITKDTAQKIKNPWTQQQIFEKSMAGYQTLAREYPFFEYQIPSQKKSLFSYPLTYMGFGGYLNPFTNEAQVNDMIPMYNFSSTVCHEMAHQMGYASESEANFIGFLAASKNEDLYFKYSAYSYALKYCLSNWDVRNPKMLKQLLKTIHPGILKNFKESKEFWQSHETFIETGFKVFYDNYLKINQQEDGLDSYSKFVDLMVNYYDKRAL
jgi:energy-coupling factor transporter transmembrane protein EcfT